MCILLIQQHAKSMYANFVCINVILVSLIDYYSVSELGLHFNFT